MNKSYIIAGAIAASATLWVASGVIFTANEEVELSAAEQASLNKPEGLQRVQVIRSRAVPRIREIRVAGRTEASRQITMRSEIEGTVIELVVPRGTIVKQGDPLIRFSINDRKALLTKSQALVAKRKMEFSAAENLSKKSFTSEVSLANAKAELESARADLEAAELELARTTVRAPFDGIFNRNHAEVGDYLRLGDEVAEMVDLDPILVIGELAELAVGEVSPGTVAGADLIDGRSIQGEISFVSSKASPETRTFSVEISVPNPDGTIIDGMTATLRLPAQEVMAHSVPPAALTLNDGGAVGVKLVNADRKVLFAEVTTSSASTDSVWLTGLPPIVDIITVGQEFVTIDQKVDPVLIDPSVVGPVGNAPIAGADQTWLAQSEGEQE
ncbi:MAG: efflux RND transporter periplasmic adaptor subunit [Alphaproteobacteria bacterium]|nr:efflux RND transporter periplasmic adaptor subunit [Alphaproteobacteria bacterium]